ncbi:hypothetical protein ABK040_013865 [Willaertia magna]
MQSPKRTEEMEEQVGPSSHDLFQKMLEEELRKEEERLAKKKNGDDIKTNTKQNKILHFDDLPLKKVPKSPLIFSPNNKEIKLRDENTEIVNTHEQFNMDEPIMKVDKIVDDNTNNAIIDKEEHSSEDLLNRSTEIFSVGDNQKPLSNINEENEIKSQLSSTLLFQQMLDKELQNDNSSSKQNDDKPAWKKKVDYLEEIIDKFKVCETTDTIFNENEKTIEEAIKDKNSSVLEKGLDALSLYVDRYINSQKLVEKFVPLLIEKGFTAAKASIQQKSCDIILLYIEVSNPLTVINILQSNFTKKNLKVKQLSVSVCRAAIREFGIPAIPIKPIIQVLSTILEDNGTKQEAHKLTIEIFGWLGVENVEPFLKDVKTTKVKSLKEEFELIKSTPTPTRFLRGVSVAYNDVQTKSTQKPIEDIVNDLKEEVDINEKLKKDWYEEIENTKWSERKKAVNDLVLLLQSFKLKKGVNYSDIFSVITAIIQREKNVAVVKEAIDCVTLFSRQLKTEFTIQSRILYEKLLLKLKEKKLMDSTIECLIAIDGNSLPFTDMLDYIFSLMGKSPSDKIQLLKLLEEFLKTKTKRDIDKSIKVMTNTFISLCDDASSDVREICCKLIARLLWLVGDNEIAPLIVKLDPIFKEKIIQAVDLFGTSPLNKDVTGRISQSFEQKKPNTTVVAKPSTQIPKKVEVKPANPKRPKSSLKTTVSSNNNNNIKSSTILSSSEVLDKAELLFSKPVLDKLTKTGWNDRVEALTNIEENILCMEDTTIVENIEIILGLFQYKPGVKESNSKVLEKTFEIINVVISKTEKLSENTANTLISWMLEKISTSKVDVIAKKCLTSICECVNPEYVFKKIAELLNEKAPKTVAIILDWLSETITQFSIAYFNSEELIEFAKKYLSSNNPIIKKSCIKLLCSMKSFMGNGLLGFLGDAKPALLSSVKQEFDKIEGPPPEPTRKIKGKEQIVISAESFSESLPRIDINPKLVPKIYQNLEDKEWTIRHEAILTIEKIIIEAQKRISPNILELLQALKQRLDDQNIKVLTTTLGLFSLISEAIGTAFEKHSKIVAPYVVAKLLHNNKAVRSAAMETLEKWTDVIPAETLIKYFPKAISSEKGNPEGKKDALEFINNHLSKMKNKSIEIFSPLVPILISTLQGGVATRPDTRRLAESILSEVLSNGGYDDVYKKVRELKPAFQKGLIPLLQKFAPNDEYLSSLLSVTSSLNITQTSVKMEKKTLRDVSKSLIDPNNMSDTDEERTMKSPKIIRKRIVGPKTLTLLNASKQINVQKVPPLFTKTPSIPSMPIIDEYKLDLDKIEIETRSETPEVEEIKDFYYNNTTDLAGKTTPRMPERSPINNENSSRSSIPELIKSINIESYDNRDTTENAITSLKTLVGMFKDVNYKVAMVSHLKDLVEVLSLNVCRSFEQASIGTTTTRICKYLLSTLMSLFSNKQMASFVPQETLQRLVDQLLRRLLDERLPLLDYGQELLRGLNSLMLKILENSNRTFSYTSLIHLLEHSYSDTSLKKYTELVVKCLIKLTKALVVTVDRVDVDILLMDLHVFLTQNPPTFFKDKDDLPLRTVKTILNELVKVKGETIRSCLNLIPTHKNPLIVSYIELMLNSTNQNKHQILQLEKATKTTQDELAEIFGLISNKDTTHKGLFKLYEFKKQYPSVGVQKHLSKCSEPFQQYIHRQLAKISQHDIAKQGSNSPKLGSNSLRKQGVVTSVDDIRRQLKLHQQEAKQKNLYPKSLSVQDLKKRLQNIEEQQIDEISK